MKKIKFTQEQFLENCKKVHENKYNYSKAIYVNCSTPVIIICKEHGEFKQLPLKHCNGKQGCPQCSGNIKKTTEQFIEKAKKIHGDKYDYSKINYISTNKKVTIICKEHGEFEQSPHNHLENNGCSKCSGNKKLSNEDFIQKAKLIHGNKYDYSKVEYKNAFAKVIIICQKHGEFEQIARNHISEEKRNGCPKCKLSKGEINVMNFLIKNNIEHERQKKFEGCKNLRALPFDFYLPDFNICIEFDGEQHYRKEGYFGGVEGFKAMQKSDKIKTKYCKDNNIKLIRIKYNRNTEKILTKYLLKK